MRRAKPATAAYTNTFQRLTAVGWQLTNYGGGYRYFARPVPDEPLKEVRGLVMRMHEVCRVNAKTGVVTVLGTEYLNLNVEEAKEKE